MQPFLKFVAKIELKKVDEIVKKRNKNAKYLDDRLSKIKEIKIPVRIKIEKLLRYIWHVLKIEINYKKFLLKNNIEGKYTIMSHFICRLLQKKNGFKKRSISSG